MSQTPPFAQSLTWAHFWVFTIIGLCSLHLYRLYPRNGNETVANLSNKKHILYLVPGTGSTDPTRRYTLLHSFGVAVSTLDCSKYDMVSRIFVYNWNITQFDPSLLRKEMNSILEKHKKRTKRSCVSIDIRMTKMAWMQSLTHAFENDPTIYDFIFLEDDDIEMSESFNMTEMVQIMECNQFNILSNAVVGSHHPGIMAPINPKSEGIVGRRVKSIEMFSMLYDSQTFKCIIEKVIDEKINIIGWGYEFHIDDICGPNVKQGVLDLPHFTAKHRNGGKRTYDGGLAMAQWMEWIKAKNLKFKKASSTILGDVYDCAFIN